MNISITQFSKCELFSQLFQHVKLFTDHININFGEEGVFIQTMDSSHISIFELNLPKSWFDEYELNESTTIGIHSSILYKILHSRDKDHQLNLNMPSSGHDKLNLDFTSTNPKVFNRNYEISLMDIESDQLQIPEIEYDAEFSLPSYNFAQLIDDFKMFGNTLEVKCSEENISLNATSQETGKMHVDIPIDDILSYAINEDQTLKQSFSIDHLQNICSYHKISKEMEINLKAENPIKINYPLDEDNAYIRFYLAPKIDDA